MINTCSSRSELIAQVQDFAQRLTAVGTDQRLMLYMIRDSALRAMLNIDHESYARYKAEQAKQLIVTELAGQLNEKLNRKFTVDDL